ncbi:hypothetical protein, partial [Pontimicrobium sp. MEBiC01747]
IIPVTEVYELEVDSLGSIKDTLSIEIIKKNEEGLKIYSKIKTFKKDRFNILTEYYKKNEDLFYSKLESSRYGIISIYEAWEKDNEIEKAMLIEYDQNKPKDTIFIDYEHFFDKQGVKKKTIITSKYKKEESNKTELLYNEDKKIMSEILSTDEDTLSHSLTKYNKSFSEKIIFNYKNNTVSKFVYDQNDIIQTKTIYLKQLDTIIKKFETKFETNNNGEILKKEDVIYPSKDKRIIIYKKIGSVSN